MLNHRPLEATVHITYQAVDGKAERYEAMSTTSDFATSRGSTRHVIADNQQPPFGSPYFKPKDQDNLDKQDKTVIALDFARVFRSSLRIMFHLN